MTRIKEPPIGISVVPNYKSPSSRIVRSLRKGYDNTRKKLSNKSGTIQALQGKLRDTQESREDWKTRAQTAEANLIKLQQEKMKLEETLKKRKRNQLMMTRDVLIINTRSLKF